MYSETQLLRAIRERVDHPATARQLQQILKVPREARATFKRHLKSLVSSGALIQIRGERFGLPDRMNLVVGRVSTNPRGFAFVEPEVPPGAGTPASIYIAGNNLNQAVHLIHTGTIPPSFGEILRRLLAEIRAFHQSLIERRASSPDR